MPALFALQEIFPWKGGRIVPAFYLSPLPRHRTSLLTPVFYPLMKISLRNKSRLLRPPDGYWPVSAAATFYPPVPCVRN